MTSEKRLEAAHAKVAAAETKLAEARRATEAARVFATEIGLEVLDHVKRNQDLAAVRAATLMRSLKIGAKPKFRSSPKLADDYVGKLDAANRAAAAKQALRELVNEESLAQRELDQAIAGLHAAARSILAEETSALVSKIQKLEAESLRTRVAVEAMARSGVMGLGRQLGVDDATKETLRANTLLPIGITNHALWRAANVEAEHVRLRYFDLIKSNAGAETPA
jgi:hypothetical protein